MATGETPSGDMPKTIVLDMVPLLDDPYVRSVFTYCSKLASNLRN